MIKLENEKFSILERVIRTTARIECINTNGETSVGTGFFFSLPKTTEQEEKLVYPFLITNKHVIKDAREGLFKILVDDGSSFGAIKNVRFNPANWILHPDNDVDIAIFNVADTINHFKEENTPMIYTQISNDIIPSLSQIEDEIDAIEDVIFIGYPSGIYDEEQLLPIARKGITATPISRDFNGKPQFLIDASVFPGSSGSPVFIINIGMIPEKRKPAVRAGSRIFFLGILSQGVFHTANGNFITAEIPVVQTTMYIPQEMIDLGIVIKSRVIEDFIKNTIAKIEKIQRRVKKEIKKLESETQNEFEETG